MRVTAQRNHVPEKTVCVRAPASKSAAHRALLFAALSEEESSIRCETCSDDILRTADCLVQMGAHIAEENGVFSVSPIRTPNPFCMLDAGESGSTLRFLLPVLGALGCSAEIRLHGRLPERPLEPLQSELIRHGMKLSREGSVLSVSGTLTPGDYVLSGEVSSQFFSGLLAALPLLKGESTLRYTGTLRSAPYFEMTKTQFAAFGGSAKTLPDGVRIFPSRYHAPKTLEVEGDWSGAAFFLAAGAFLPNGVCVTGLSPDSAQGDKKILSLLREFGARVEGNSVFPGTLRGITADTGDIPDLVPVLAVLGAAASGTTVLKNAGRLRLKESDRLSSVTGLLRALGAEVREGSDFLEITGKNPLRGGECDGCSDHRIVMSAAVAALFCETPVTVTTAEAVRKSYPDFFTEYEKLGMKLGREKSTWEASITEE